MVKFGRFIANHRKIIMLIAILLLIPAAFGYFSTNVNYDILTYLPKDIDTMIGQDILIDEFGKGGFSMVVTEGLSGEQVESMCDEFEEVEGVASVISYESLAGTTIPEELLPDNIASKLKSGDDEMVIIFFSEGTSSDTTLAAIQSIRDIAGENVLVGSMSAIIADTRTLCEQEEMIYVLIAVVLCMIVLAITMDSFMLPFLFMASIAIAIVYNLGTNIFLGEISYLTKALAAVLQLAVTMDYSIFLWHSYKEQKMLYCEKNEAMAHAIALTFKSVVGSSLTTIAGFIALCFMTFTLGFDMGIVLAKGVVLGVISCVTILPALILLSEKAIAKTTHKSIMPKFDKASKWIIKNHWVFIIAFLVIVGPAIYGYSNTSVYYKLDTSLPERLDCVQANEKIADEFGIGSAHMLLIDSDLSSKEVKEMTDEMEEVDGVTFVLGESSVLGSLVPDEILPSDITFTLRSENHQLILIGSEYETASDEVNSQIEALQEIAKKYDDNSMLIGEAPGTKDLITITDHDFAVVSIVSIALVFIIIAIVLKSIPLAVILVAVIEFAIFINLGIPGFTGTKLAFIASIVVSTIQLGATVDYAILMTNRYLDERRRCIDKKNAIATALKSSAVSILVSAIGFFAATIGVSIYSEVDLIGSLCFLMARGALISMAVVLLVLPSFLYVFDKIIIKTTFGMKKEMKAYALAHAKEINSEENIKSDKSVTGTKNILGGK